ncbi:MAG: prephenate dehydrogenase/arogenate dehydrogenase family protein [Spirochaetales bacterium]|nr:prephenate dehydrogenase/arogenate dehydrogenase family protein [Spirochaetales bacterium]
MNVAVYGMGRFGSFWASVLSGKFNVSGFSRSNREYPSGVQRIHKEEDLAEFDTIFLCCAISAVEEVLKRISPFIKEGATVIDTCSVKEEPVRLMLKYLPESCGIIATHPMFGPDSGRDGVAGLPIVFHVVKDLNSCGSFWFETFNSMKMVIHEMTPDEHDREAAFTQGITHFIGRVLNELDLKDSPIATLGYKKLLEIVEQTCNDPIQLFMDLQKYNNHTKEMRSRLQSALANTMDLF